MVQAASGEEARKEVPAATSPPGPWPRAIASRS